MGLLTDLFVVFVGDLGMKKGLSNDSPETVLLIPMDAYLKQYKL